MHGEIDHHADIGHARRKRPDTGDRDRENILALDRLLDGSDRRIEALDMADHQRDIGAARGGNDGAAFLDGRGDRLFHQHMNAARDAGERNLVMQMRRRGDGHGIDAGGEQTVEIGEHRTPDQVVGAFAMLIERIDDADERDIRQSCENAAVIGAHDTRADHADAQRAITVRRCGRSRFHKTHAR